jgi:hypothetical protein
MRCTSSVAWNIMTVTFTLYAFKMFMAAPKNLIRSKKLWNILACGNEPPADMIMFR